jgi:hypothetical protein
MGSRGGEGVGLWVDDWIVPANLVASYLCLRSEGRAADAARPGIFSSFIGAVLTCSRLSVRLTHPGSTQPARLLPRRFSGFRLSMDRVLRLCGAVNGESI